MMHEHHLLLGGITLQQIEQGGLLGTGTQRVVARPQRGPAFVRRVAFAKACDRHRGSRWRRTGRRQQMLRRQPVLPARGDVPHLHGQVAITGGLLWFRRGAHGGRVTTRQAQGGKSAGVADHHAAHQVA